MNTVQGMLGKETVEVLRDTGCSGVIVKKILVTEEAYTERNQTISVGRFVEIWAAVCIFG